MSAYQDLLATIKYVRDRTDDPNAWQTGLTPNEVHAVLSPTTRAEERDVILRKIRQQHSGPPPAPRSPAALTELNQGDAAAAIAEAEAALAHQNSASSQLDLQVISAILNAHLRTVEGREVLNKLQQETEAAVRTRSDLDTPAGARDFQRFLIGKLRDIRAVVANANLDDTSKSALMAAWTALYEASKNGADDMSGRSPAAAPQRAPATTPTASPEGDADPLLDSLLLDDPALFAGDSPPLTSLTAPSPYTAPTAAATPSIPNFGLGPVPGMGMPSSLPAWSAPGGLPLSGPHGGKTDPAISDPTEGDDLASEDPNSDDRSVSDDAGDHKEGEDKDAAPVPQSPPSGPTTVTLPDGETVTAASPQLAAAITAVAGGASIADAFQQQGITIPPPGTAVPDPIDPSKLTPGDIGIFTDRHALALSRGKALLDGQIQRISTVTGPSFLGWEHPPTPATATAPARAEPTPTRPAAESATR